MQKIAIIGGGIMGMTLANYLDQKNIKSPYLTILLDKQQKPVLGSSPRGCPNAETNNGIA